jgi:tRNA threonylcarbamoyladenosine biosynthesis protein TsaB
MLILGIDTTSSLCSLALAKDAMLLAHYEEEAPQRHAQILVPRIMDLLRQADISFNELGLLAVTTGPGSFTGIRTGLATMQGLQLSLGLPLLGINVFELYASQISPELAHGRSILVVLENQKSLCYAGLLNSNYEFIKPPAVLTMDDLSTYSDTPGTLLTGTAASIIQAHLSPNSYRLCPPLSIARASMLCAFASTRATHMLTLKQPFPLTCKPFYIAPPATTSTNKKHDPSSFHSTSL